MMTCDDARRHWDLFHDSEGDAELHLQIGEHLANCPACARWFHQESRLEHLIVEKLRAEPETPELWSRVLDGCGLVPPRPSPSRRWMLLACAASIAAIAGLLTFPLQPNSREADLAQLTASWHERLVEGREPVPFRSQSDREVEHYLRQRLTFSVRCPPRRDAGFAVQGTGVCTLADQPSAFLVGDVGKALVSIFVLPIESLDAFPHQRDAIRREGTHQCREGPYEMAVTVIDRNVVLVVGQARPDELLRILAAYGSYPEHKSRLETRDRNRNPRQDNRDPRFVLVAQDRNRWSHS